MRFESRMLQITDFVSRKIKNTRYKIACYYSMRHNGEQHEGWNLGRSEDNTRS